jgi:hypothetical protein
VILAPETRKPPLLIGLEFEDARERATAAGWAISVISTVPVTRTPTGPQRVVRQRSVAPETLELVIAASVPAADAPAARRLD